MSAKSYAPFACIGCAKEEREIEECRIKKIQFEPYGKRCPRQGPQKPVIVAKVDKEQFVLLPPELIVWKDPIRGEIKKEDIDDMATSIMSHGLIEPIVVAPPDEKGFYEGVCGRLRYEAIKRFQGKRILARVYPFESEDEKMDWKMAENLHRRELTTIQKAEHYERLYKRHQKRDKHVVSAIAKRHEELTGEKNAEKTVYKYLEISMGLNEDAKKILTGEKNFGVRHAEQLLRLKDMPDKQVEFAREFVQEPLTVKQLKKRVDELVNPPKEPEFHPECPVCGKKISKSFYLQLREKVEVLLEEGNLEELFKEWVI